jgi:hypothetical protein
VLVANESVEGGSQLFLPLTLVLFIAPFAVMIIHAFARIAGKFVVQHEAAQVDAEIPDAGSSRKAERVALHEPPVTASSGIAATGSPERKQAVSAAQDNEMKQWHSGKSWKGYLDSLPVRAVLATAAVVFIFLLGYNAGSLGIISSDDGASTAPADGFANRNTAEEAEQQHARNASGRGRPQASKHAVITSNPVTIRRIQALLKSYGYDPGPVDGAIGVKTEAAIMKYQAENGLSIDGLATRQLLTSLESVISRNEWLALSQSKGYKEDPLGIYVAIKKKCGAYAMAMHGKNEIMPCPHIHRHGYIEECFALPHKAKAKNSLILYDSPGMIHRVGSVEEGESITLVTRKLITVPIPVQVTIARMARSYPLWLYPGWSRNEKQEIGLKPGEIIQWITGIGEGVDVYYRKGSLVQVDFLPAARWKEDILPIIDFPAETRPVQVDWFEVETVDGKRGWTPKLESIVLLETCS